MFVPPTFGFIVRVEVLNRLDNGAMVAVATCKGSGTEISYLAVI